MARTKQDPPAQGEGKPARRKRFAQLRQVKAVYAQARTIDPAITWWMLGAFVLVEAVMAGVGFAVGHPVYLAVVGVPLAVLAAGIVMARRAERAAYRQLEGQPGGSGAALQALRRGWHYEQQPIAVEAVRPGDLTSAAMVFRAVGRPGVVLVVEGPPGRAQRLGEGERKRLTRLLSNVPVHVLRVGTGEDEVPVRKLAGTIQRMRPALTKAEVAAVNARLRALGGLRAPVPKGVDPMRARPDRKGLRGR